MNRKSQTVDIIVPIYNGYEDLQKCIPSILRHTDLNRHRLVLINDCSPDARIRPYLDGLCGDPMQAAGTSAAATEDQIPAEKIPEDRTPEKSFPENQISAETISECPVSEKRISAGQIPAEKIPAGHILVLHNSENLGFSGNVNKGMALSEDHDVLLLNSDTIVTAGWLEKIVACAYRDDSTGTVTPLSNSATLCSVPVFCRDNPVPEHLTIDEYAALIERCSLRRYPQITVAVGFCMFIKRCLIDDIGNFDAETFGRGYGEENDFCNRAEQAGYHHIMCDDTFVYHKGTGSFDTAEKQALLREHTAILTERYPEQMHRNDLYCVENPDQEIRDNINLYTKLCNKKKNLLYFLHLDFQEHAFNNIGGTQIHVRELMEELRGEYNVFVMARDADCLRVTAYTDRDVIPLRFEIGEAPQYPVFRDQELRRICIQVLKAFSIDLVHVHHTQDLSLEIYDAAAALGIPVTATMHDYYYACPTILLLDNERHFCAPQDAKLSPQERRERCQACLLAKKQIAPQTDYLRIWRREHGKALRTCKKLIFPSASARDILLQYFPELKERCQVIYHGEDRLEREVVHVPSPQGAKRNAKLRVKLDRVVGADQGLNDIKGWAYLAGVNNEETEILVELTDHKGGSDCFLAPKAARPDIVDAFGDPDALLCGIDLRVSTEALADGPVKIQVYVCHGGEIYTDGHSTKGEYRRRFGKEGRLNVAFLGGMVPQKGSLMARKLIPMDRERINWFVLGAIGDKQIMEIHQDNCFFSSTYKKEELPQLLADNEIDVVCILPIWPETFCYTVSEAWMNGIPVVGTDIGAVGERIRSTGGGWLVSPDAGPEEVLGLLHRIQDRPQEYREKKEAVARIALKSVTQMCGEYRALYAQLLADAGERKPSMDVRETFATQGQGGRSSQDRQSGQGALRVSETELSQQLPQSEAEQAVDYDFIFQGLALGDPSVGGRGGNASMNRLKKENAALKASIEVMKGTTSYRLARRISDARIPFKEQLKKQARNVLGKRS